MPFKPSKVILPATREEASESLEALGGGAAIIAGGTMLFRLRGSGLLDHVEALVDLSRLGLSYVRGDAVVAIGSYTPLSDVYRWIASDPRRGRALGALADAIMSMPGWQIRNMATVGGSASIGMPQSDIATSLLALGARARISGPSGERVVDLRDYMAAPLSPSLGGGEFLSELVIEQPIGASAHEKFVVSDIDHPIASASAHLALADDGSVASARIALGGGLRRSVVLESPRALVGRVPDEGVLEEIQGLARDSVDPLDDFAASAEYRRHLAGVMARRAVARAYARAGGSAR
ncbi:MAG: FAD binding domain-containing protein [Nitrososphaeria archaeon]